MRKENFLTRTLNAAGSTARSVLGSFVWKMELIFGTHLHIRGPLHQYSNNIVVLGIWRKEVKSMGGSIASDAVALLCRHIPDITSASRGMSIHSLFEQFSLGTHMEFAEDSGFLMQETCDSNILETKRNAASVHSLLESPPTIYCRFPTKRA